VEFGLFSNGHRNNAIATPTYDDDLHEIITADRLGFHEAWISEHIGLNRPDTMPAPELLICKAIPLTKHIRLGPAVRLLALYHPIDVATQAAVCDHLSGGRYLFGFGSGAMGLGIMQQRGMTDDLRHPRMLESIDLILKCWTATEPFDYQGQYWQGTGINVYPRPLQRPHMPIAIATRDDANLTLAARNGFIVLFSQYDRPARLCERSAFFLEAQRAAGRLPSRKLIRVCRLVHVSDSTRQGKEEIRAGAELELEDQKTYRAGQLKDYLSPSGNVQDVTFDYLVDEGMFIVGDPDTVYQAIKAQYDTIGGFGTLLLVVGKDWTTRRKRDRSMRLFMEHVAPRLARLDPDLPSAMPLEERSGAPSYAGAG
jgi:alkanesulfonate monooxygenase SsuD/methylene tetrahydromethanopterin reductase-like flavin-dependent oxidoreductase (luciferase family)